MGLLLVFTVAASLLRPMAPSVELPDTPAGRQLGAYIAAFDSGSRAKLRAYVDANFDRPPNDPNFVDGFVDGQMTTFSQTGGVVVRKIEASTSAMIKVLTQSKLIGGWAGIEFYISAKPPEYREAAPPFHIVGIGFHAIEAPPEFTESNRLSEGEIRSRVDQMMRALVAHDAFSGTVTVAKAGRPFYGSAFGLGNRVWNAPNRPDTKFDLASITKMFTAVAVAQLVEAGKLSFSETVGHALLDYPQKEVASSVTISQLLSHTSGLIGARELVGKHPMPTAARTVGEMLKGFVEEPLSFPPGQQFQYSNAGFVLLGSIIERASGQSYYDYVRQHIFTPAGMRDTDFYELDSDPRNLATGFKDGPNGKRLNNIFDLGVKGGPDGGAFSTGPDMVRFSTALLSGKLVGKPMLEMLWTGVTEEPQRRSEYGYGAQISYSNGNRVIWHGGGWPGVTNQFDILPELGYTVVILSNYDDDPGSIDYKVREWLTQGRRRPEVASEGVPAISVSASCSASSVRVGDPVIVSVAVSNAGGTAHASIVDFEVKDASGVKAFQRFTAGQKLKSGQHVYTYSWTPTAAGHFTIDLGVFSGDWSKKYIFKSGALSIDVN